MIERIFHPIGQGAFYTEKHDDFTIVYDCGNWKNSRDATKVVKQGLKEGSDVDILFISHFDYDHVSKIDILKKHTNIKIVVLPLLHENEKIILLKIYKSLGYDIMVDMIQKPESFFGKNTKIIRVKTVNDSDENENKTINIAELFNSEDTNHKIDSGTRILNKFDNDEWVYIPYNFEFEDRLKALKNAIQKAKINFDALIDKNKCFCDRKKARTIYNSLAGNINQNSMLVYSGPLKINECCLKEGYLNSVYFSKPLIQNKKIGCLYTGDADLNTVDIKDTWNEVFENIGTIQTPHHGSIKNFNLDFLKNYQSIIFPTSVGNKNTYGHPSNELFKTMSQSGNLPIKVTEELSSKYIELLDLNSTHRNQVGMVKYYLLKKEESKIDMYMNYLLFQSKHKEIKKDEYALLCQYKELKDCL